VEHVLGESPSTRLEQREDRRLGATITLSRPASLRRRAGERASTNVMPRPAQRWRRCALEPGSLVEQSTMTRPFAPPSSIAFTAASTCGEPVTPQEHEVAPLGEGGERGRLGSAGGQQVGHSFAVAMPR